jgi:hypothetical protein
MFIRKENIKLKGRKLGWLIKAKIKSGKAE